MSFDPPPSENWDATGLSFAIVAANFNRELVDALVEAVRERLHQAGVLDTDIEVVRVPGSGEIPFTVSMLADFGTYNGIIALGVVIAGDTSHHDIIGNSVSQALQIVAVDSRAPIINGVIVCNSRQQAEARCTGDINRGLEFAEAALAMASVHGYLTSKMDELIFPEAGLLDIEGDEDDDDWTDYLDDGPETWKS